MEVKKKGGEEEFLDIPSVMAERTQISPNFFFFVSCLISFVCFEVIGGIERAQKINLKV